jgi:hypothetical protein
MSRLNPFGLFPAILMYSVAVAVAPLPSAGSARPGRLNAITGEVSINGVPVDPSSAGRVTLEAGRAIRTGQGMAEILLSPGSFLRLGNRSELTLETAGATEIRARITRGEGLVEVLDAGVTLTMEQNGVIAIVRHPGLYEFNEKWSVIAVYVGAARLNKNEKQLVANAGFGVRTRRFRVFQTRPDTGGTLFAWSRSRSEQLSNESRVSARESTGAARSYAPQWQWDPWSASYTFLSASGFVRGPFGWPYFSPGYAPDHIPVHRGDSWLYGPPVLPSPGLLGGPGAVQPREPERRNVTPIVPLTAPGEPRFPSNK